MSAQATITESAVPAAAVPVAKSASAALAAVVRVVPAAAAAPVPGEVQPRPAAQALTATGTRVGRWLDTALNLLSRLPQGPVTELLAGALWNLRRALVPTQSVSSSIGVNLSTELADPAPTYRQVVGVIKQQGITSIRMYDIVPAALNEIKAQIPGAKVSVSVPNPMVAQLASDPAYAKSVVATLKPYGSMVTTVTVGNEVDAGPVDLATVTRAVRNMQDAIAAAGLPIATTVSFTMSMITDSYPPSNSVLNPALPGLTDLLRQLKDFVEIDIYPLDSIQAMPTEIALSYALGNPNSPAVDDKGVIYHSLFWAEYDAVRWALNKAGITIPLRVGETGWATNSVRSQSVFSTVGNARVYNQNVIDSMATTGSPKFKVTNVPFYLFELIDENQKTGGMWEPYWGWYAVSGKAGSVTLTPKYSLSLKSASQPAAA